MMVFQTNYLHIDGKDKTLVLAELLHTDMSYLEFLSSFSYISHELSRLSKESDVSGLGCHIASRTLIPKCSMTDKDLALMNAFCLNFNGKKLVCFLFVCVFGSRGVGGLGVGTDIHLLHPKF